MEQEIRRRVKKAIREKLFPGCVVGVVQKNGNRIIIPVGRQTYKPLSRSIRENSVYDVASITKAIPLAMVTLSVVEQGVFALDDTVVSFIPRFDTSPQKRTVTLKHLLTNTVDLALPPLSSLKDMSLALITKTVTEAPLVAEPGTVYKYSNASALLLSLCLMKATKCSLGFLAKTLFFDPLEMRDTTFDVRTNRIDEKRIVPTQIESWRNREIRGEVHDESTYALQRYYGVNGIGIAGLFSTAPDLLTFLEMLLQGGTLRDRIYFSEIIVTQMYKNHFPYVHGADGFGWTLYPQDYMGRYGTPETFGKTGFTGCMVMADRKKELGLVILSNYHYPKRKSDLAPNTKFRADIADIVFCNRK